MHQTKRRRAPTRRDQQFHRQRAEFLENSFSRALSEGRLTEDDVELIREFLAEVTAENNISVARANKLGFHLIAWRRFIGPFCENSIGDLRGGLQQLKTAPRTRRLFDREMPAAESNAKPYTKNSVYDFVTILKRFYRWMIENDHSTIELQKLNKIRSPGKDRMTKTVEMIPTEDEVRAIVEVCQNPRDRAIFAMLWDGGFRIAELGTLTWGQIKFTEFGCAINVNTKTEFPRYVPLLASSSYLAMWRDSYPCEITSDALVFLTRQHRPLSWDVVNAQLKKMAKKAGITKHLTLHAFRHGRATEMLRSGLHETVIKKVLWGNTATKCLATYEHLTDRDIDDAFLTQAGIRTRDRGHADAMAPRECARCGMVNPPTAEICWRCATPLSREFAASLEELNRAIERTPEWHTMVEAAMRSLPGSRLEGDIGRATPR
ncbi:MAG: tyrosine-type recombinase/integrase [Methanospirillum sp.]